MMQIHGNISLDEFVTFQRGFDLPRTSFVNGDVPVFGSTSILGYHDKAKVKGPGVITGRSGTLGKFQYSEGDYWPHNTTLWVKDFKGNDPKFAFYLLQCLDFKALNGGGAVPTLNRNVLKNLRVNVPPLPVQKQIGQMLSVYDNLIENNSRRIALLEKIVMLTYEEWFKHMRFPGAVFERGSQRFALPEGWGKMTFADVCHVAGGGTPSTKVDDYWKGGDVTWFSPTDLSKSSGLCLLDSSKKITMRGLQQSSAKIMPLNSFMMTSRATIGLFGLIDGPYCTNQGFINVIPLKEHHRYYLLFNLKSRVDELKGHATGATFAELSRSKFRALPVVWPDDQTLHQFHHLCSPVVDQMMNLTRQNELLHEAKGMLLPRFIRGAILPENYGQPDLDEVA